LSAAISAALPRRRHLRTALFKLLLNPPHPFDYFLKDLPVGLTSLVFGPEIGSVIEGASAHHVRGQQGLAINGRTRDWRVFQWAGWPEVGAVV
jgi:hypothetical protein